MHDKEIILFTNGLKHAHDEFFLDAISEFQILVDEFPDSELVDDSLYNIGLCYFEMNHFIKAIETYNQVINDFPESTISILEGGIEFGKTAAKCHYAILNCYLALNELDNAKKELDKLKKYTESYILVEEREVAFFELADDAFNTFMNIKSNNN